MNLEAQVIEKLKALNEVPVQVFIATVKSVDADACTCDADAMGITWNDIRIRSQAQAGKVITVLPKVDSSILVARIGNSNELYVAAFSEVDQVLWQIGDASFKFTEAGAEMVKKDKTTFLQGDLFTIKTQNESLKKILSDLIDAIGALTVTTGVGPSGIPINKAQFDAIKNRLANLLNE
jgi:hypothetical protein